jgi:hypothetical protein
VQDARARADAAAASAETVQSASRGAAAVDERALAELSQRIAVVEASARTAADLAARMPALENGAKAAAELSPRVAAIETGVKSIQADLAKQAAAQAAGDRAARFAVATGALNAAVERGTPFATEFAAVKPLAPNAGALAPLESVASRGVPGVEALARELAALIPAIQRAAGSPNQDGSVLERLQANAERLVRIRRVEETPGDDPAAVVSRIEAKAAQQDVDGALAELAKLPPAARAPAEDWIKKAQSRRAALEQSRRLHADALAALGKP